MSEDTPDVPAEAEAFDGAPPAPEPAAQTAVPQTAVPQSPVPQTGDPAVDEALSRLAGAADLPLEEQVGVFDAVHRTLQDRLADVDG